MKRVYLKNSPYYCSGCGNTFDRKWNAFRHNKDVHDNQGEIYNKSNNLVYSPGPLVPSSSDLKTEGSNDLQSGGKELNNNGMFNSQSKCRKNTDIDSKSDDDIYYDGIGELAPSMDELNALLSEKPPHVKEKVLGMMLTWAFSSQNPVKSFKENLSLCKNITCSNKITECISSYGNIPKSVTSDFVRNSILRKIKTKEG